MKSKNKTNLFLWLWYGLSTLIQGVSKWSGRDWMPLRDRRINIYLTFGCLVTLGGVDIWVSSICFQKSNIDWPQQPLTEKVLKFNMIFADVYLKNLFFWNIKIKLNSNAWVTLKSLVVIFQALKPLQPQWPLQPQNPYFTKELPGSDGWIIPGTKMTNTGPFLWN